MKTAIFLCFGLLSWEASFSQENLADSLHKKYPFIPALQPEIGNSQTLKPFYDALKTGQTVSVVHLGDSHIQADHLSGRMRKRLQDHFGDAGWGVCVPWRVVKSNESPGIMSASYDPWKVRKVVKSNDSLKVGISGAVFMPTVRDANIDIHLRESPGGASEIDLFCDPVSSGFSWTVADSLMSEVQNQVVAPNQTCNPCRISLKSPSRMLRLRFSLPESSAPEDLHLHGLCLSRPEQKGILYHAIGVNGAEFRHYIPEKPLFDEMQSLKPNLLIISLGTNEAYGKNFNADEFTRQIDSLLLMVRAQQPNLPVLLTLPGDALKRSKYKNPNNRKAGAALKAYAEAKGLAWFDTMDAMGGKGSILKWAKRGLTSKDKLHLSRKGYQVQADLLYHALERAQHALEPGQ